MARAKSASSDTIRVKPAITEEAREQQLVALAIDLAEQQLLNGTASSQVITHYLKIGSSKERLERQIREKEKELIEAKTENLRSAQRVEELYANAIKAIGIYAGRDDDNDEESEDDY